MTRLRWHHTAEPLPPVYPSDRDRRRTEAAVIADRMRRDADEMRRGAAALEREAAETLRSVSDEWLGDWTRSRAVPPPLDAGPPLTWRALRLFPARAHHVPALVLDLTTPEPRR